MAGSLWVLITGASSGIGEELAYLFAREGRNIILVSRNQGKLTQVSETILSTTTVRTVVIPTDLSEPGSAARIYQVMQALGTGIEIDVLVNNAGVGEWGKLVESEPDKITRMLHLNMISLAELTQLFAAERVKKGSGRILNVASVAAFQPIPLFAAYAASKSFVLSFSLALSEELRGTGVSVTCLAPGATATGFADAANMKDSRLFAPRNTEKSSVVAQQAYKALMDGERLHVVGLPNKLLTLFSSILPTGLILKIARRMMS